MPMRYGRAPTKGARVSVKGKVNDFATFGGSSIGLHLEQEREGGAERAGHQGPLPAEEYEEQNGGGNIHGPLYWWCEYGGV